MDSRRLELQLEGSCHNTYVVDVFYHQLYYTRFIHLTSKSKSDCDFNSEKIVMDTFCSHDKIVHKMEACILHELLRDVSSTN